MCIVHMDYQTIYNQVVNNLLLCFDKIQVSLYCTKIERIELFQNFHTKISKPHLFQMFLGLALVGMDIVLKTVIEYSSFKVFCPLHSSLSFL